jgi:hypothetical protein
MISLSMERAVKEAAREYLERRQRQIYPEGHFDRAGRWYPSPDEWQRCCDGVSGPSRARPYRLLAHCRTMKHVAKLYDVDPKRLREAANRLRRSK